MTTRTFVDAAIAAGKREERPNSSTDYRVLRGADGGKKVLVSHSGAVTAAGRRYYERLGRAGAAGLEYDQAQTPQRRGRTEFITLRNGQERAVRMWDTTSGRFKVTKWGERFFKNRAVEVIAQMPVHIVGYNDKNKKQYGTRTHMPVTDMPRLDRLIVQEGLSAEERRNRVVSMVLQHVGGRTEDGKTVVHEQSNEVWYYDRDGEWRISELRTTFPDSGRASVQATIDRPLRGKPMQWAFLPDGVRRISLEEEGHCVVSGMADCLKLAPGFIEGELEDIWHELYTPGESPFFDAHWRDEGATARMVEEFCKRHDVARRSGTTR